MKKNGILVAGVYERVGKSVSLVFKKAQKGQQMNFMAVKESENVLVLWLIHF